MKKKIHHEMSESIEHELNLFQRTNNKSINLNLQKINNRPPTKNREGEEGNRQPKNQLKAQQKVKKCAGTNLKINKMIQLLMLIKKSIKSHQIVDQNHLPMK